MTDILQRIYDADFAMKDSVADVMEDWDGARLVADGRAPSLWEWNHAALLRSDPDNADALIERIKAFYHKRKRTASILIDPWRNRPACATAWHNPVGRDIADLRWTRCSGTPRRPPSSQSPRCT